MHTNHRSKYRTVHLGLELLEDRTVPASLVALNNKNTLLFFDSSKPSQVVTKAVTNLRPGDELVSIDQDPSNGLLLALARQKDRYGVSFYLINTATGVATLTSNPDTFGVGYPLKTGIGFYDMNAAGTFFGVSPDGEFINYQLTEQGIGYLVNSSVGIQPGDSLENKPMQLIDGVVTPSSTPGITSMYLLDMAMNTLRRMEFIDSSIFYSPQVSQVGFLGMDITENTGLDIGADGKAYLAATNPFSDKATLYTLNLTNGLPSAIGTIGAGTVIRDLAALSRPVLQPALQLRTTGITTTQEDKRLVFSAQNRNAITLSTLNGSNPILNVSLQLNNSIGTLQLSRTTGLEFVYGDGLPSAQISVRGSLSNLNAALSGMIFTPNADLNGDYVSELSISAAFDDQSQFSAFASVTMKVTPVNDAPRAVNDQAFIQRVGSNYQPAIINVLANDTDPENDALSVSAVTQGKRGGQVKIVFENNTTLVRYQPSASFTGSDEFTYTVRDSLGGTSTARVIIGPMSIQTPGLLQTLEDTPLPIDTPGVVPFKILYAGTDDPEVLVSISGGYYNRVGGFELSMTDGLNFIYGSGSRNDNEWRFQAPLSVANSALKSLIFYPFDNLNGNAVDAYQFSVDLPTTDPSAHAFSKNISVLVNEVNDPPKANDDLVNMVYQAGALQTPTIIDVMQNDSVSPDWNEGFSISGWNAPVNGGTVLLQNSPNWPFNTSLRYIPPATWSGFDEFTYTIRDTRGLSSTATVKLGELRMNIPSQQTTLEDVTLLFDTAHGNAVQLEYAGSDDPVLVLRLGSYLKLSNTQQPLFNYSLNAYVGTLSQINAALQTLQFVPPVNSSGVFDANNGVNIRVAFKTNPNNYFDYGVYGEVTGNLSVKVLPVADAPQAVDDEVTLSRMAGGDYQALVMALANDISTDRLPLQVVSYTQGMHGAQVQLVNLGGTEGWGFHVTANTLTAADEFSYTITDAGGLTSTATVYIKPFLVTVPSGLSTLEDVPLAIGTDPNNRLGILTADGSDPVMWLQPNVDYSYSSPFAGSLSFSPTSGVTIFSGNLMLGKLSDLNRALETMIFTPVANRFGMGTISVSARLETASYYAPPAFTGRFNIDLVSVTDPPVANADRFQIRESLNPVFLHLLLNDQSAEIESTPFFIKSFSAGDHGGQITLNSNGLGVDYKPTPGYRGTEQFTYTIQNAEGLESTALVTVTVTGPTVALGAGAGQPSLVTLYNPLTHQVSGSFIPFASSFTGGVHVAIGDVDGDGRPDIVCAQGSGGTGNVQLYHDDGTRFTGWMGNFQPFGAGFTGNVEVALTDFNGDASMDMVFAARTANGVEVKVVQGGEAAGFYTKAIIPNIMGTPRLATNAYSDANNVMVLGPNGSGGFNTVLYNIGAGTTELFAPTLFTNSTLNSMVKAHGPVTGYDVVSASLVGEWYLNPVVTLTYADGSHQMTGIDSQRLRKVVYTALRRYSTLLPPTEVRAAWMNTEGIQGGFGNLFLSSSGGRSNFPYLDPLRAFQQLTDQTFQQLFSDNGSNRIFQKGVYVAVA